MAIGRPPSRPVGVRSMSLLARHPKPRRRLPPRGDRRKRRRGNHEISIVTVYISWLQLVAPTAAEPLRATRYHPLMTGRPVASADLRRAPRKVGTLRRGRPSWQREVIRRWAAGRASGTAAQLDDLVRRVDPHVGNLRTVKYERRRWRAVEWPGTPLARRRECRDHRTASAQADSLPLSRSGAPARTKPNPPRVTRYHPAMTGGPAT